MKGEILRPPIAILEGDVITNERAMPVWIYRPPLTLPPCCWRSRLLGAVNSEEYLFSRIVYRNRTLIA